MGTIEDEKKSVCELSLYAQDLQYCLDKLINDLVEFLQLSMESGLLQSKELEYILNRIISDHKRRKEELDAQY